MDIMTPARRLEHLGLIASGFLEYIILRESFYSTANSYLFDKRMYIKWSLLHWHRNKLHLKTTCLWLMPSSSKDSQKILSTKLIKTKLSPFWVIVLQSKAAFRVCVNVGNLQFYTDLHLHPVRKYGEGACCAGGREQWRVITSAV